MMTVDPGDQGSSQDAAIEAYRRGYYAVPIRGREKRPHGSGWTRRPDGLTEEIQSSRFGAAVADGATNIGLVLGQASGGLVDVDMDNPLTYSVAPAVLPPTAMVTGRVGRPRSHFWYRATGEVPGKRSYKMPDGSTIVEFRSDGHQTLIPPSIHPSGESYRWESQPWGGESGPAEIEGTKLAMRVATTALICVLKDHWPDRGGRHDAYLALAGGLLRYGDQVHPFWEKNLFQIIDALAQVTHDEEERTRSSEVLRTTIARLQGTGKVVGYPTLAEIIGEDHVRAARTALRDIETLAGWSSHPENDHGNREPPSEAERMLDQITAPRERNPMDERLGGWEPIDMVPYLTNQVVEPEPTVFPRSDGACLMYPGRVNLLYGASESAKSLLALWVAEQEMSASGRVVYVDFEDMPDLLTARARALGISEDDLENNFAYISADEPLQALEVDAWGHAKPSEVGERNQRIWDEVLRKFDPTLVVLDGTTDMYTLHGLDPNILKGGAATVGSWMKSLLNNGRRTVIIIDHTNKHPNKGDDPTGSQHKKAVIQGTQIHVWKVSQPGLGAVGELQLLIHKDRPGKVRRVSRLDPYSQVHIGAEVVIDSSDGVHTFVHVNPPTAKPNEIEVPGDSRLTPAAVRVSIEDQLAEYAVKVFDGDLDVELSISEIEREIREEHTGYDFSRESLKKALAQAAKSEDSPLTTNAKGRRWMRYRLTP